MISLISCSKGKRPLHSPLEAFFEGGSPSEYQSVVSIIKKKLVESISGRRISGRKRVSGEVFGGFRVRDFREHPTRRIAVSVATVNGIVVMDVIRVMALAREIQTRLGFFVGRFRGVTR